MKGYECGFLLDWMTSEAYRARVSNSPPSWMKAHDKLVAYGLSIGFTDVEERLFDAAAVSPEKRAEAAKRRGEAPAGDHQPEPGGAPVPTP